MAKAANDAGLWPLLNKESNKNDVVSADLDADPFGFPSEFPYELGISSPVESVAGSTTTTETESSGDEEEDFFAALTRRLSQSSLHANPLTAPIIASNKPESPNPKKIRGLAGSPQSTLSGIGSWSGRSALSSEGSPNGSSRVPSPTTTPFGENNDPWEAIYAAAGQVARLKYINGETASFGFQNKGSLPLPHATLFSNQATQVREEHVLKQQCGSVWGRQAKPNWLVQQQQQVQYRARDIGYESVKCTRPSLVPQSEWSPQPQNQRVQYRGSGSRHGLPGGSAVKKGCGGTGVFLPRHYVNNPTESRKKFGKSTASVGVAESSGFAPVMVPAKVVHALNYMNMNDLNAATSQPRISNTFATNYDALLARRNALLMQQRLILRREEASNYETRLPQEWTY